MNIFQDMKTAASVFTACRKARKNGERVEVKPVYRFQVIECNCGFGGTVEGWNLNYRMPESSLPRRIYDKIEAIYNTFDPETQHNLHLSYYLGWTGRARFWQRALKPALPRGDYYIAISSILREYQRILKQKGRCTA